MLVKNFKFCFLLAWMAALLYLPRLFVYHADAEKGSVQSETFKVMERRLYRGIMTPAMVAAWLFGLWMLILSGFAQFNEVWMWVKIALVLGLSGFHGFLGGQLRHFSNDANTRPAKFFRLINEVPTAFMIIVVVMVIGKPF